MKSALVGCCDISLFVMSELLYSGMRSRRGRIHTEMCLIKMLDLYSFLQSVGFFLIKENCDSDLIKSQTIQLVDRLWNNKNL